MQRSTLVCRRCDGHKSTFFKRLNSCARARAHHRCQWRAKRRRRPAAAAGERRQRTTFFVEFFPIPIESFGFKFIISFITIVRFELFKCASKLTRFVAVTFLPYFYRTHGYVIVKTGPDDSDEAASSTRRHTESTLCEPRTRGWR